MSLKCLKSTKMSFVLKEFFFSFQIAFDMKLFVDEWNLFSALCIKVSAM